MTNQSRIPNFQGDIVFVAVDEVPVTAVEKTPEGGRHIVAHSETGHHHYVDAMHARCFDDPKDPNVCYLQTISEAEVVHDRTWDTHAAVKLPGGGCFIGIRQVENSPAGWRRVAD